MDEALVFYPENQAMWRQWLAENHVDQQAVWVVFYTKPSGKPSLTWSEAVDVALCFGWIDSKKIKIDHEMSHQFFSKRKPKGTWSKINKEKIERLSEAGLMTPAGLNSVEIAKKNGSWTILDDAEALIIPRDLAEAFKKQRGAKAYFLSLSKTTRKMMLTSLVLAKRPETRQKRIEEIAVLAGQKKKPKQF